MINNQLPSEQDTPEDVALQIAIEAAKQDISSIKNSILAFEELLKQHVSSYIIEAQELTVLYKSQKKAKRQKRLAQKHKGKHYTPTNSPEQATATSPPKKEDSAQQLALKKQLYREAMLQVHPDKFSLSPSEQESATEITTQLIHIYKNESLTALQNFHAQIFSDTLDLKLNKTELKSTHINKTQALQTTLKTLHKELETLKTNTLYHTLNTYSNPLQFVDELIMYYKDKIAKLKKRTRTKN